MSDSDCPAFIPTFSPSECRCVCTSSQADCRQNEVFDLATCSCKCPNSPPQGIQCFSTPFERWDTQSCSCICDPLLAICPPGYSFDSDSCLCTGSNGPSSCPQKPADADCGLGSWNDQACQCLCTADPGQCIFPLPPANFK